jgi:hypothetical protein
MAETPFSPASEPASDGEAPGPEPHLASPVAAAAGDRAEAAASSPAEEPDATTAGTDPAAVDPGADVAATAEATSPTAPEIEPLSPPPAAAVPPPAAAAEPPGVVATLAVPPLEDGGEGGEWQVLVGRIQAWLSSGELNRQWQRFRGPLKGLAILLLLVLLLRLYATAVTTIEAIPLLSGLLELTGLIAALRFSATRLVRSGDRRQLTEQLQQRWRAFSGRG